VGVGLWSFVFFGLIASQSSTQVLLAVVVGLFFHSDVRPAGGVLASVITVVAVLLAKETRGTSLRHDRVVRDAHR
jgi:hypothetical protein